MHVRVFSDFLFMFYYCINVTCTHLAVWFKWFIPKVASV